MTPAVASCLCVAFVLWALRRQAKLTRGLRLGLWLPFVWVGINASKPVGYWFEPAKLVTDVEATMEGSPLDRNLSLLLIALGLIALLTRRIDWRLIFAENRWLWIFHAYLLISVAWSDYPFVAFKRWFKDLGNVIMILIIVTEKDPVAAVRRVLSVCPYFLLPLSVLFIKYYPAIGRGYDRWVGTTFYCGVTTNKNALGVLALLSGLMLVWNLAEARGRPVSRGGRFTMVVDVLLLVLSVWILIIARSATSSVCFVVGLIVFVASHFQAFKGNIRRLSWCGAGMAFFSLLLIGIPELRTLIVGGLGRDVTLTGRTIIWQAALDAGTDPLIGTGFGSFWLAADSIKLSENWALTEAHNGYLETYLNSGLIGVALLVGVLIAAGKNALRQLSTGSALGHFYLGLFLSGIIYNYTEAAFNVNHLVGFWLWLIAVRYSRSVATQPVRREAASDAPTSERAEEDRPGLGAQQT